MAQVIWSEPALTDLEEIAEYIALDKPKASAGLVQRLLASTDRLELFPMSGKVPTELPDSIYRELVVLPCRVFHRLVDNQAIIVHVMRGESQLRRYLLGAE